MNENDKYNIYSKRAFYSRGRVNKRKFKNLSSKDYDKSEFYFKKSLAIIEKALGENRLNTKIVKANYLVLKMEKGDKLTEEEMLFLMTMILGME